MVALPATGSFLYDPTRTNDMAAQQFEAWLAFTRLMPGGAPEQLASIVAGSITPAAYYISVDTEGQAASDDLDYIVGTNFEPGQVICVRSRDSARTVVLRHARGTSNQLFMLDGANLSLTSSSMRVYFQRSSTQWLEVDRVYGTQHAAFRTWIGLSNVPLSTFSTGELSVLRGAGGAYNHGLGGSPVSLEGYLICKTAEEGYAVNDIIKADGNNGFDASRHIMIGASATQVFYKCIDDPSSGDSTIFGINRVSGSPQLLTPSRWRLIIRAWR